MNEPSRRPAFTCPKCGGALWSQSEVCSPCLQAKRYGVAIAVPCPKPWCSAKIGEPCHARIWNGPKNVYTHREHPHAERRAAVSEPITAEETLDAY